MAKVCMKHCHTEQMTGGCAQAETCPHFAGPSTEGSLTYPDQMKPCGSRLPCGVCMITGQICPLAAYPVAVPWWQVNGPQCEVKTTVINSGTMTPR